MVLLAMIVEVVPLLAHSYIKELWLEPSTTIMLKIAMWSVLWIADTY